MNPNVVPPQIVEKIMVLKSEGHTYKQIAEIVGRSPKTVEGTFIRNRHHWSKAFNFPHIIHAKRFGAGQ